MRLSGGDVLPLTVQRHTPLSALTAWLISTRRVCAFTRTRVSCTTCTRVENQFISKLREICDSINFVFMGLELLENCTAIFPTAMAKLSIIND
jgi:hypothetical protein